MKKCPFCAEEIQDAAVVCRYCGRELAPPGGQPGEAPRRRRTAAEERLWTGRPGLLSHFWKVVGGLLLIVASIVGCVLYPELWIAGVVGVALGVILLALAWLGVLRYRYELTTLRAIAREGIFNQTTSEIQLDDVRNVLVQRGLSDRLLGLGTISLSTAGQAGMEVLFRSVPRPQAVVELINRQND